MALVRWGACCKQGAVSVGGVRAGAVAADGVGNGGEGWVWGCWEGKGGG